MALTNTKSPIDLQKKPSEPLTFKIKLLSGNNVVLVDCVGYESELFIPQIIKGRITFQNIIPNHRCCDAAAVNVQTGQLILPTTKLGDLRVVLGGTSSSSSTPQRNNYELRTVGNMSGPLARSTPACGGSSLRSLLRAEKENVTSLLTPEQARSKPTQKVAASPTPVRIGAIQSFLEASTSDSTLPIVELNDSFTTHSRPDSGSSSLSLSPTGKDSGKWNFMHKAPPVRTYARRKGNTTVQAKTPPTWSPLVKKKRLAKVSSTKPPSPRLKLEVRRRKLIVDQKKSLNLPEVQKLANAPITKTKIRRKQVTGKTRQQFEALKRTAFDLVTTPAISHISAKLTQQFQDACIEKYSDTLPSYAALADVKPLEMDTQVRVLMAKKKRLEKQMTKSEQARYVKN